MENLSASGQTGIGIPAFTLLDRDLHGVSVSKSGSTAVLAGDGDIGDRIGVTAMLFSIITDMCPTAECSPIVNISIVPGDFMELTEFTAETREDSPAGSMDSPHRMP